MANAKSKLANRALRLLNAATVNRRISASAQKSTRSKAIREQRELQLIDASHGYECSWCGCRFPETPNSDHASLFEKRHLAKVLREKQFSDHFCSETRIY